MTKKIYKELHIAFELFTLPASHANATYGGADVGVFERVLKYLHELYICFTLCPSIIYEIEIKTTTRKKKKKIES